MAITLNFKTTMTYANPDNNDDVISQEKAYPNAYAVVSDYNGTKNNARFSVTVYEDSSKQKDIWRVSYEFSPSTEDGSENIIRQAYAILKAKSEFLGAIDC